MLVPSNLSITCSVAGSTASFGLFHHANSIIETSEPKEFVIIRDKLSRNCTIRGDYVQTAVPTRCTTSGEEQIIFTEFLTFAGNRPYEQQQQQVRYKIIVLVDNGAISNKIIKK
jgi:hypothetical protein